MDSTTGLKKLIHIQNEYQRIAAPILEHVKTVCKPFIGKKVDTQKGLASKLSEALKFDYSAIDVKPIAGAQWAKVQYVSVSCNYTDIQVEISLCFGNGTTGCTYEKRTWYFGKTDGHGNLLSINDECIVEVDPIDYNTEVKAIIKFSELEKQLDEAKQKIRTRYVSDFYKHLSLKDLSNLV
jgi:hypothetical protein